MINQRELLEWFEDVAIGRAPATAVRLLTDDLVARRETLRGMYARIVGHPRFGGAWPPSLPAGAIAPQVTDVYAGPPPESLWFAVVGSPHPYIEMGQLVNQLEQLRRFVHLDSWVNRAAAGEFRAVLSHASAQSPGDVAALAFGFLDPHVSDRVAGIASATRALDEVATRARLARDGGALGVDGPRSRARALVCAGWLQRLATARPVVVVVDDAHRAGPFVTELVHTLLASPARVLVVLAGDAGNPDRGGRPARLAGSLGGVEATSVATLSLADDGGGRLAAALATVDDDGLFLEQHARLWATDLHLGDHRPLLVELMTAGWIRPVVSDVWTFATTARHRAAKDQQVELAPDLTAARQVRICERAAATTTEDDEITHVVAYDAWASQADGAADARWQFARILATRGQLAPADRLGRPAATTAVRRATVDLWRADGWPEPHQGGTGTGAAGRTAVPTGASAPDDATATVMALEAAAPSMHPEHVSDHLTALLDQPAVDITVRLAATRLLLSVGDVGGAARVIGADAPQWLSAAALTQLDQLTVWRDTPGLVARSVEVMVNLHAIATLRQAVPDSLALAHLLVARLDLLERYGRLETADDAMAIADEAVRIFATTRQSPPTDWWTARRSEAWTRLRRGHADAAVVAMETLLADQRATLAEDDPVLVDTRVWYGRCLLAAGRAVDAHAVLHDVRRARERTHVDEHPELLAARQWHAASKVGAGDPAAAIVELQDVARLRAGAVSIDDEDHLAAQHLLGSALAASGRWDEALGVLDHVLARRSRLDLPDAPRVLAARFSRATCLTFLQRSTDAVTELDEVIALADSTSDPGGIAVNARNARGVSRLMAGEWAASLLDLDDVVNHHAGRTVPDDEVLLCARQQRAECLRWLGRHVEAALELDRALQATAAWPSNHPLVRTFHEQRATLSVR